MYYARYATLPVTPRQPTAASASTDLYGMATLDACNQILKRLIPVRSKLPPSATCALARTIACFAYTERGSHRVPRATRTTMRADGRSGWCQFGFVTPDFYADRYIGCHKLAEVAHSLLHLLVRRLAEVAFAAFFARVDLSAHGFFAIDDKRCGFDWAVAPGIKSDGTHDNTTRGFPFNYFTQGVGCCEVEVDVLTGDHHVVRADLLVDLGSSINPALDIGQIEGAFTQGMGWSTMEELIWGDEEHAWVRPAGRLFTQVTVGNGR